MSDKTHLKSIPELMEFINKYGRHYLNSFAHKLEVFIAELQSDKKEEKGDPQL